MSLYLKNDSSKQYIQHSLCVLKAREMDYNAQALDCWNPNLWTMQWNKIYNQDYGKGWKNSAMYGQEKEKGLQ